MSTQYRIPSNDNYIRDLENISQRERHGLFNQPPPLLLGDQYNDALKSQGKEKGILVNKKLQKKHEPTLFLEPGYTTLNDPYKDQFKAKQIYDKERELAIKNQNCFKPNDQVKSIKHSEFEHMKEFNDKVYTIRQEQKQIIIRTRNKIIINKESQSLKIYNKNCFIFFVTQELQKVMLEPKREIFQLILRKKDQAEQLRIIYLDKLNIYLIHMIDKKNQIDKKELSIEANFYQEQLGLLQQVMVIDHLLLMGYYLMEQDIYLVNTSYQYRLNIIKIYLQYQEKKRPLYKGAPFRPANQNKRGFQGTFEVLQYLEEGVPDPKTKQNTFQKLSATQTYENPWRPNSNGTFARPCPSVSQQIRHRSVGSNQKS